MDVAKELKISRLEQKSKPPTFIYMYIIALSFSSPSTILAQLAKL